ncbi:MAG: QueT transporter family protein [Lachnospiraceae bacterium]
MKTNNVSSKAVLYLVQGALIAALYVVLTMLFEPISFGPVQFRISETLVVLPFFTPAAIPGVTIGCFLANLFSGAVVMDVALGSLATLIGAVGTYLLRKHKYLVSAPPIVSNTLIVPWVLKIGYGAGDAVPFMMVTVGIGEILAVAGLGTILLLALERHKNVIFRMNAV